MKTNIVSKIIAISLVVVAIPLSIAETRSSSDKRIRGNLPSEANMAALKTQLADTTALFRRLDSDGDGKLSAVEFARITSIVDNPPGAATNPGLFNRDRN